MPQLASIDRCVGCTACVSICPMDCLQMKRDDAGFIYPQLVGDEKCINCGRCENVCPVLKENSIKNKFVKAYAAYSLDRRIQDSSSSGGIFTELALIVLKRNGIVYGAAYDDEWKVSHIAIDREEFLYRLRGAKYVESSLGNTYKDIQEHLKNGKLILFSGTPCQVAGLKSYLHKNYGNLICVDFVCHGIPSPLAWTKYIEVRKKIDGHEKTPIKINQRSKETGWSRYTYSCLIEYDDGTRYSRESSDDLYMKLFCNDYISRSSCKTCIFKGYERVSDITLGDFWGIWNIDPDMDNEKGTSLVLVHSELGMMLFLDIKNNIKYKDVTLEEISKENPSILYPSSEKSERASVLEKIKNNEFDDLEKLFSDSIQSTSPAWKRIIERLLRRVRNKGGD